MAKIEMNGIVAAMRQYQSVYNRWPVSDEIERIKSSSNANFTFGTVNRGVVDRSGSDGKPLAEIRTPHFGYTADNREVMAILMALPAYPNGMPTCNSNDICNPAKTPFLNAKITSTNNLPGVGNDYVFRDPWGNPYIITINLKNRDATRDAFYSQPSISEPPTHQLPGYYSLRQSADGAFYEADTSIMIWSLGPDGKADPNVKANEGVNKDNILSWQ